MQQIALWPAPDRAGALRVKGRFGLLPFAVDTDSTTLDDEAIFLLATANFKAHLGQPDANNYMGMFSGYVDRLAANQHGTRRYIPGNRRPLLA